MVTKTARKTVLASIGIAGLVLTAGCSTSTAPTEGGVSPIIQEGGPATTVPGVVIDDGALPAGAADVEAAYVAYVDCMVAEGLSGTIRFDLNYGTALIEDVALGVDPDVGEASRASCLSDFDPVITSYIIENPVSDEMNELTRQRFLSCAQQFFPGQIDPDAEFDPVVLEYNDLLMSGADSVFEASACAEEALAGPQRQFG